MGPRAMISACASATDAMRYTGPAALTTSSDQARLYFFSVHVGAAHLGVAHSPPLQIEGHAGYGPPSWWSHIAIWYG